MGEEAGSRLQNSLKPHFLKAEGFHHVLLGTVPDGV